MKKILVTLALAGCARGTAPGTAPQPAAPPPALATAAPSALASDVVPSSLEGAPPPLPAGLYFRDGYLRSEVEAEHPQHAVVSGVFADAPAAEAHLRTLRKRSWPPGYPLVVHSDELCMTDATRIGVVVVAGLFVSRGDIVGNARGASPDVGAVEQQ